MEGLRMDRKKEAQDKDMGRRDFIKKVAVGSAVTAPLMNFQIPIVRVSLDELLQKHFKEMSEEEKKRVIERLEKEHRERYGVDVKIKTTEPLKGVVWGYALNIKRCIGCRRCVYACVKENNQSRASPEDPTVGEIHWIRVVEIEKAKIEPGTEGTDFRTKFGDVKVGISLEEGEHYYDPEKVPEKEYIYIPIQCQQCEKPPCVKVCPTKATWKEPDGVIVVDYNWCIGCRYCMAACPYWARRFNWTWPYLPKDEINPDMHYLGNRIRYRGVVEKCTFCIQRTREGRYPACLEACPVGARKFGNLLDPESEIRKIIDEKRVFRLKEELGTEPKFFYYMD